MHLLIAGSPPTPTEDGNLGLWRVRAPYVPLPTVTRGQQRPLMSPVTGYPPVSISPGQYLDRRPTFQAGAFAVVP
jgi:hypothetical protein